jgi:hypothetical protein
MSDKKSEAAPETFVYVLVSRTRPASALAHFVAAANYCVESIWTSLPKAQAALDKFVKDTSGMYERIYVNKVALDTEGELVYSEDDPLELFVFGSEPQVEEASSSASSGESEAPSGESEASSGESETSH